MRFDCYIFNQGVKMCLKNYVVWPNVTYCGVSLNPWIQDSSSGLVAIECRGTLSSEGLHAEG